MFFFFATMCLYVCWYIVVYLAVLRRANVWGQKCFPNYELMDSKVGSPHLWYTPLNLYQPARVIAWSVLWGCVVIFLDGSVALEKLNVRELEDSFKVLLVFIATNSLDWERIY